MSTSRVVRLVRVADLRGMHAAIAGVMADADPLRARETVVLLPTRSAAAALRGTLESRLLQSGDGRARVLPELLTREELYGRLYERLPEAPPLLTGFEREVLFRRAAREAAAAGAEPPFRIRAGLIGEMLAFYDELRRRDQTIGGFDRLVTDSLAASVDIDRGAERLMRQTRFLSAAFAAFERGVAESGSIDEHGLRARLIETGVPGAVRRIAVTVADQASDPRGLWAADYDLLARLPGLEAIEVIATERSLAAGFHQRLYDLLPGLTEDVRRGPAPAIEDVCRAAGEPPPVLVAPETDAGAAPVYWFTSRDREEELADVAAAVKTGECDPGIALVFQRPLPYLYLAKHVFAEAEVPYHALDALPLAAEPFAAALDLVLAAALSEAGRPALVELLASPHWRFAAPAGDALTRGDVRALDAWLLSVKYFGGWDALASLAGELPPEAASGAARSSRRRPAALALHTAVAVVSRLQGLLEAPAASAQVGALAAFVRDHERMPDSSASCYARHLRARAAVLDALEGLAAAHRRHDDEPLEPGELAGSVRRWIEEQTFSPRTGTGGVTLLDAAAAAYGDPGELRLLGLVESDWPDRRGRNIFYPPWLLAALGWPPEADRLAAARSRFRDLLGLARARVSLSTFTLEDDAIVPPSPFLEEAPAAGFAVERRGNAARPRVFVHEALAEAPVLPEAAAGAAAAWLALRMSRDTSNPERFRGAAGPRAVGAHAVSHVERYLECPFKYFANHVLRLDEEKTDQSGLTPQERGQFLHEVFERFFRAWHEAGRGAVTGENLSGALDLFEQIADARLATLSERDRALERTYLLGSAVAPGLAGRAFAFEIEHGIGVIERLLEHALEGPFVFEADGVPRRVNIRAKADRIDLLEDGTLRVIDYKLGRAPKAARALQLPIYSVCAAQHLDGRHGRRWTVSRAGYVAFRERNAFVPLGASAGPAALEGALQDGQKRFLAAVDAIERGEFPVDPDEPFLCTRCGYAGVCRKDYVGDE